MPLEAGKPVVLTVTVDPTEGIKALEVLGVEGEKARKILEGAPIKLRTDTAALQNVGTALNQVQQRSGVARLAVISFSQGLQDSTMFAQSFRMGMMSIGNNLDMVVQYMGMLKEESRLTGVSMKDSLLAVIKGPSGVLVGLSVLIGLLQLLPQLFRNTSAAAKEASEEGLKIFTDWLDKLTTVQIQGLRDSMRPQVEANKQNVESLQRQLNLSKALALTTGIKTDADIAAWKFQQGQIETLVKQNNLFTEQIDKLDQALAKRKAEADTDRLISTYLAEHGSRIQQLNYELEQLNQKQDKTRRDYDRIAQIRKEINTIASSTADIDKLNLEQLKQKQEYQEALLSDNKGSVPTLTAILQAEMKLTTNMKDRYEIEKEIQNLRAGILPISKERSELEKQQAELETKSKELIRTTEEERVKAEEKIWTLAQSLGIETITDEFAQRRAAEDQRHTKAMADIEAEAAAAGAIGMGGELTGDFGKAATAETLKYHQTIAKIDIDRAKDQIASGKAVAESIADQELLIATIEGTYRNAKTEKERAAAYKRLATEREKLDAMEAMQKQYDNSRRIKDEAWNAVQQAGANATANYFVQSFDEAWTKSFGKAHSLLQMFLHDVLSALVQIAAQEAAMAVFGFLANLVTGGGYSAGAAMVSVVSSLGLPAHAEGGITTKPHVAVVGEVPEVIIPLSKLPEIMWSLPPLKAPNVLSTRGDMSALLGRLDKLEKAIIAAPTPVVEVHNHAEFNEIAFRTKMTEYKRGEKRRVE